jgi:hypothetical protein
MIMKMASTFLTTAISAIILCLTGCSRQDSAKQEEGSRIQPGGISQESEQWGYLAMKITKVREKQKALDVAPWFADGGDWTFLECETEKDPAVRILVGTTMQGTPKGDIPISWGEAVLTVADAVAGARFVETLAKAFHQPLPASRGQKPALHVKMRTAVLGTSLVRDPRGGFKDGRTGNWVATKWFLQDETAEAEIFFNFSTKEKRAEFSEKDEEYREDLIKQLVVGLRDGPLPERTLESDPSLTAVGPTITDWIAVGNSNETCQFSQDSSTLMITVTDPGQNSQLFVAPTVEPTKRKLLASFEGSILVQTYLSTEQGATLLVTEMLRQEAKTISSLDPQRLWLVDPQGKHEVRPPAGLTNWFASKHCLSPDARFVTLGSWETQPDKKRARVIHLGDLQTGKWQRIALPATLLELVGWIGEKPTGLVLTGLGVKKDEVRKAYSFEPITGQLSPLAEIPREFTPGRTFSPDGKRFHEVIGKERLVITDTASGQHNEFAFHPYDRRNVYPDSVQWAGNRYLVFQTTRTALINADTLKMSYPTTKESGIDWVEFSSDFKLALGHKDGGLVLGRVLLPVDEAPGK